MAISSFAGASSVAPTVNKQVFTASGSFIKPANVNKITITACGGGGGYPSTTNYAYGSNGAVVEYEYDISSKPTGASIPIVVGAGGVGVNGTGGTTVVDNLIYAPGGVGASSVNQPDGGVLSASGNGYLTTTTSSDVWYQGANTTYHHMGYRFVFQQYIYTYDVFGSIITQKPDGTRYTYTPTSTDPIYYFTYNYNYLDRPSIATDGNGTIVITGFFRPSVYESQVTKAAIVTTNHGQTWSMLDQSAVRTALGVGVDEITYSYVNGRWFACLYSPTQSGTGSILATSTNLSSWALVGSGKLNASSANNDGSVPYGGTKILSVFFDAANSFWYVSRWSRPGYYSQRIFIEKSSSADLSTATWSTQFFSDYGNGGDYFTSTWGNNNYNSTIAKKTDGSYVHSYVYVSSSTWERWEFSWSLGSTSASGNNQTLGVGTNSSGMAHNCGFSEKLQKFIYFTTATTTSVTSTFFTWSVGENNISAQIFSAAGNNGYRYNYLSIGGPYDSGDKNHYIAASNSYTLTELRRAILSPGGKYTPLGAVGSPGYNGPIKKIGSGTGINVYIEPAKHPDKFTPAQYTDSTNYWFIYDATWPGTGGLYMNSEVNGWSTRNGNSGQVIIRWVA